MLAALTLIAVALAMGGSAYAAKPCWRVILDDWTDNTRIDGVYSIACYDAALSNIPGDLKDYTDAYDQIANARQDELRGEDLREPSGPLAGGDDPGGSDGGVIGDALGAGNGDSGSIPLPLIILGALAGLLMAAGGAGLLARKLQARRGGPPTAP